ncbi:MAG: HEPN domain-containing protein [Desulfobaccales bacterium]
MAFSWRDYLLLIQEIYLTRASLNYEEAIYRCAISRSYYAAFCGARNFARDHQSYVPSYSGVDHLKVRDHFRQKGRADIADKLWELHKWRIRCDYRDTVNNLGRMTTEALKGAFEVFNHLSTIVP